MAVRPILEHVCIITLSYPFLDSLHTNGNQKAGECEGVISRNKDSSKGQVAPTSE